MSETEICKALAAASRDCREEMRDWAHGWRKARPGVLKTLCLRKAIQLRDAASYYSRRICLP